MLTEFWESAGKSLSETWIKQVLSPAFIFWMGGLTMIVWDIGFYKVWEWITSRDLPTQTTMLIIGLLILLFSTAFMSHLRFSFLRFLEGYWQKPFHYLGIPLIRVQRNRIYRDRERWNQLMEELENKTISIAEKQELSNLEVRGHYAPAALEECMPTALGNILRAAEAKPRNKYGLDAIICWPRLWLLLPEDARSNLSAIRQNLDSMVELWAWGLFFLVWAFWWPWAIAISAGWMWIAYALLKRSAMTYADLIESAFDTYRFELYKAVRWPLPNTLGKEEIAHGRRLTTFLWRGYTQETVSLKHPKDC